MNFKINSSKHWRQFFLIKLFFLILMTNFCHLATSRQWRSYYMSYRHGKQDSMTDQSVIMDSSNKPGSNDNTVEQSISDTNAELGDLANDEKLNFEITKPDESTNENISNNIESLPSVKPSDNSVSNSITPSISNNENSIVNVDNVVAQDVEEKPLNVNNKDENTSELNLEKVSETDSGSKPTNIIVEESQNSGDMTSNTNQAQNSNKLISQNSLLTESNSNLTPELPMTNSDSKPSNNNADETASNINLAQASDSFNEASSLVESVENTNPNLTPEVPNIDSNSKPMNSIIKETETNSNSAQNANSLNEAGSLMTSEENNNADLAPEKPMSNGVSKPLNNVVDLTSNENKIPNSIEASDVSMDENSELLNTNYDQNDGGVIEITEEDNEESNLLSSSRNMTRQFIMTSVSNQLVVDISFNSPSINDDDVTMHCVVSSTNQEELFRKPDANKPKVFLIKGYTDCNILTSGTIASVEGLEIGTIKSGNEDARAQVGNLVSLSDFDGNCVAVLSIREQSTNVADESNAENANNPDDNVEVSPRLWWWPYEKRRFPRQVSVRNNAFFRVFNSLSLSSVNVISTGVLSSSSSSLSLVIPSVGVALPDQFISSGTSSSTSHNSWDTFPIIQLPGSSPTFINAAVIALMGFYGITLFQGLFSPITNMMREASQFINNGLFGVTRSSTSDFVDIASRMLRTAINKFKPKKKHYRYKYYKY